MVGAIIKAARQARGFSLGALALRAGVNKSTLSRWESGKSVPYASELTRVIEALGLPEKQRQACWQSLDAPRAVTVAQNSVGVGTAAVSSGELLRALRMRSGVQQADAARASGVTQSMISRWESGECWPEGDKLHALCFALGATAEEVVLLTTRGWQQHEPLPNDKEALDRIIIYIEQNDCSDDRALLYLALAGRYQTLYQQGKISEVDANYIWGVYGHYLASWLGRSDDALRVVSPALKNLRGSSQPLTNGQLAAVNALVLATKNPTHRTSVLTTLVELTHRVPGKHRSWWLTMHAATFEGMGQLHQAAARHQEAIRSAYREVDRCQYQQLYVDMLLRNGQYREAHNYLTPPDPQEPRPVIIVNNLINHVWTLTGLGERTEAQLYLSQALSFQKQHFMDNSEDLLRLERWLTA